MSPAGSPRPQLARALDLVVLIAFALALVIDLTGGFTFYIGPLRVTAHEAERTFFAGLLLLVVRLALCGRGELFAILRRPVGAVRRRFYRPHVDPPVSPVTWRQIGLATLGLCLFGTALLWTQLRHMDSVPDMGDPLFSMWRMGWVYHWLHGDSRPLFSPNIFYPAPLTLTYSDSMLWPALTDAPLLAAGVHPLFAYNILFVSSFVLSGVTMFALARHLTGSSPAAFVAALLFGFYPYRFQHHSHLELQMTYWMPAALLAWHRFFETARLRYAVAAALASVGVLYSSMYYGVFFTIYLVPVLLITVVTRRVPIASLLRGGITAAAIAGVLAVPLARPYFAAQQAKGERDIDTVAYYSATFDDWMHAHERSVLWGHIIRATHPERELFPGAMSIVLAAGAFVPPFGPAVAAYGAGLLTAFDGSLGTNGVIYKPLYHLSGVIRGLRAPARFAIIVGMTLALLSAFSVARLMARLRTPARRHLVLALLVGAIAIDLWPRLTVFPLWRDPPPIYSTIAGRTDVVLADFPLRDHLRGFEGMPSMYFSQWHWANMINGASGFQPRHYEAVVRAVESFPDADAVQALADVGVTHVSVNCALYTDLDVCRRIMVDAERSPRLERLAAAKWQGEQVTLFRLK